MTCPIESLPGLDHESWDVDALSGMSGCVECTAEPGEGILWRLACPPPGDLPEPLETDYDDIPF